MTTLTERYKNRNRDTNSTNGKTKVYIPKELVDYEKEVYKAFYEKASDTFKETQTSELTTEEAKTRIKENINKCFSFIGGSASGKIYKNTITFETRKQR